MLEVKVLWGKKRADKGGWENQAGGGPSVKYSSEKNSMRKRETSEQRLEGGESEQCKWVSRF